MLTAVFVSAVRMPGGMQTTKAQPQSFMATIFRRTKMAKKKNELVPYEQLAPGFEAVYTGETSCTGVLQ